MYNDYPIRITRKKIKNMYLRIQPDGTITVSAPNNLSDKVIREFVESKADWIEMHLAKLAARQAASFATQDPRYVTGEIHYLWGQPYTLVVEEAYGKGRVIAEKAYGTDGKCVENPEAAPGELSAQNTPRLRLRLQVSQEAMLDTDDARKQRQHLLTEFYREQLKKAAPPLMEKYILVVGKAPTEWRVRNMKTKWGTCNVVDTRIWLSLNLAKKNPQCLEYVIAHELTHLHEPNHSKKFWAHMDHFYPEWRKVRKLLNEK